MHEIVIRGGTIVDGTGAAAFAGDIAVDGGKIAAVGGKAGPGRRVIDANGLLVTPGWVDVHTHYDGQATWDPVLAPSSWQGVTTILFGNCGVGFAPVRPYHRDALIDLMEGVEDIPGPVLAEGLKWDWESFPDFLDVLERMPRAIDVAAQVPHHPLRVLLEAGCHGPVALDLTESALVVDEKRGAERVAAAVAAAQAHVDGDLHSELRGVNTSGRDLRCKVPDGQATSG